MSVTVDGVPRSAEKWVLVAAVVASGMAFIDGSALDVVSPALQADLGIDGTQLFWIISIYALFLAALLLVGGSMGDHYGRKRVFMIGISVFSAGSLVCGLAPNPGVLIGARAIQGIGGALMVPGSLAILSASFSADRRGRAIGTWSTFSTLTTLIGPVLGGWLAGLGLWRVVFFINLPLAVIALLILSLKVPESRDETISKQLDYPGALLVTLGLAAVTFGFLEAPTYGLSDPRILLALIGGLVALIVFVLVEARSSHPMIPLKLFRSHTFSGANALTLFLYAALRIAPFFLILNLVQVQGYKQEEAGFAFLPFGILLASMSRWAGGLVDRVGPRLPLTVGPFIAGVGFFMFTLPGLTNGPTDYWTAYFPAILILGVGMGVTVAPLTTAVMGAAPAESTGTASGINNAVARTAGVLAVAIVGSIALFVFSTTLDSRTTDLNLTPIVQTELRAEASKLGDAVAPAALSQEQKTRVETDIKLSFVYTFRVVAMIAGGLAWLSALLAWLLIQPGREVLKPASA
jgi:EmrB/QacA subfamily drug resistance transporter